MGLGEALARGAANHGHGRTCVMWRSSTRRPEGFARSSAESASEMGDARRARSRFPGARKAVLHKIWGLPGRAGGKAGL